MSKEDMARSARGAVDLSPCRASTSANNQSLLEPAARSRPFGTSALRSRRLLAQAPRPPADVRDLERYVTGPSGREEYMHRRREDL